MLSKIKIHMSMISEAIGFCFYLSDWKKCAYSFQDKTMLDLPVL